MIRNKKYDRTTNQPTREWEKKLDDDIKAQKSLFTEEEYAKLLSYRKRIIATSHEEKYPGTDKLTGGMKMDKPLGEVLGKDFQDYYDLASRLK